MKKSLLLLVAIGLVSFGSVYGQATCNYNATGAQGTLTFNVTSASGTPCDAVVNITYQETMAGFFGTPTFTPTDNSAFTFQNSTCNSCGVVAPTPTSQNINWDIDGTGVNPCSDVSITMGATVGGDCNGKVFSISANGFVVLPVELTYFKAIQENNEVNLTWQTASEEFNRGFEVQRSADGENWEVIDFVAGAGTTVEVQDYEFTDTDAQPGINYYRLKQMDFDGEFEYSDVVSVELGMGNSTVGIFPNPVKDQLNLTGIAEGQVTIYNTLGQPLKVVQINNDFSQISMTDLPQGQYLLEVLSADGSRFNELIIKN